MNDSGIEGYRAFLVRRDGDADLLHRRLASREDFFSTLEADPVRSTHPIDRQVFLRNLRRRRPEPGVEHKMLFLLATAKLNQAENATAIAQEAARAGAGMVNQGQALSTGSFTVDQAQAIAAAEEYLSSAGYHGSVTPVGTESIQVTVTVTGPTKVLSIIGVDSMTSTGSATASLVTGVTGPQQ